MRFAKAFGAAGALITAALVGGTLIGSTLAVGDDDGDSLRNTNAAAYCDTFMDALASELGTTREGLVAAGRTAANAAIDAAVAAGDITEERASTMRERVAAADGEGCSWLGRGGFGGGFGGGHGGHGGRGGHGALIRGGSLDAAAEAMGIAPEDFRDAVRDAGGLEALATAEDVAYDEVKAAVLAALQTDLDAAVASGDITQERADAVVERTTAWLDDGGELRGRFDRDRPGDDEEDASASPAA